MTNTSQSKVRRLGKGLSAIIGQPVSVVTDPNKPEASTPGIVMIPSASVKPSRFQPRRVFDQTALERLSDSIKSTGMMQPVIVRGDSSGGYELVAGERRWRAAALAGLPTVPAIVRDLSDEQAAEWAIIENVQREDLNPIERAFAFRNLVDRFRLTHQQIADRVGLDRSSVANTIRLTELEEPIRDMIQSGRLNAGHGKALLMTPPGQARIKLAEQACDEYWSVRKLEREAAAMSAPAPADPAQAAKPQRNDGDLGRVASRVALERALSEHLGTKVTITTNRAGDRGRLSIEFYGLAHFDGLLARLGYKS
ncbi:MAG: ParB/RepB/Spo0J family partition protein [Phycisphaeraceae bacterium]|nr:ParB/RepB/Spo0J family partition protein [Phycisphaeraceae bacterium]